MSLKPEEIFNEEAKKGMIQYHPDKFKREFPHLYQVIIKSIIRYNDQHLKK